MDGIINVYKEAGFTSFDVVAKLRGILKQKKIGHTGTLDPDAEGVLPVCIGKATKVCEYLTKKDKIYRTVLHLGITTDTQDCSGTVLKERILSLTEEQLRDIIHKFEGKIMQVPPMYSALKVNGKKLCDLARAGIEVERKAREVEIFSIDVMSVDLPFVTMQVHCSKGTYIRTLCQDIGELAGCGGCMEKLLRVETAGFSVRHALRLCEIEKIVSGADEKKRQLSDILVPVDGVLNEYPKVTAKPGLEKLLQNGGKLPVSGISGDVGLTSDFYRVYDAAGVFVGLFSFHAAGRELKPEKMFYNGQNQVTA